MIFLIKMPFSGFWAWYARACVVLPVVGWFWAKQICERTAKDLRERWDSLLSGSSVGAKVPEAVPSSPGETAAEQLRQSLARLSAEQQSNSVFYAGPKGILGMGTRWGSWQLAENLVSARPRPGDPPLPQLGRHPRDPRPAAHAGRNTINTGGFPKPSLRHWVVTPIAEGAKAVSRPGGTDVDAYQVKTHAIQDICNKQQFGGGDRHYLGVQWTLWDGQLVLTMLITVTVLHETLRIEVTGHALGPVHGLFTSQAGGQGEGGRQAVRFWETRKIKLPLVDADEVVRLAARAPLTWYPPLLNWLGGSLALPEPFGLRHAWADQPWRHRFMADDALRAATPVLRVVHAAAIRVLEENGVDTEKFGTRAWFLSTLVQDGPRGRPTCTTRRLRGTADGGGSWGLRPSPFGPDGPSSTGGWDRRARPPPASSACPPAAAAAPCVADDRHEVRVAAPARNDVLVEVGGDAGAGDRALVHADVEAVRPGRRTQGRHRLLGQRGQFGGLRVGEVRVVGDMTVGHDHQMAAVVRVQVEHRVDLLAAPDHQAVLVGFGRNRAEGAAVVGTRAGRLVLALDVGHPVGRPQTLERVLRPHSPLLLRLTRHAVQHMTSPVRAVSGGCAKNVRASWTRGRHRLDSRPRQPRGALGQPAELPLALPSLVFLTSYAVQVLADVARSRSRSLPGVSLCRLGAVRRRLRGALAPERAAAALRPHALAGHPGAAPAPPATAAGRQVYEACSDGTDSPARPARARDRLRRSVHRAAGLRRCPLRLPEEHAAPGATIRTFGDAVWWTCATFATVGYGDVAPVTALGRLIAVGMMAIGLALLGAVTGTFASWLLQVFAREDDEKPPGI